MLIRRSAVLLGATVAALALLAPAVTMAQAPRPDFPGAKQQDPYYSQQPMSPQAISPRPDFPGAKQPDTGTAKTPQSDLPGSQQGQAPVQK
jgi:hypothetical protein